MLLDDVSFSINISAAALRSWGQEPGGGGKGCLLATLESTVWRNNCTVHLSSPSVANNDMKGRR